MQERALIHKVQASMVLDHVQKQKLKDSMRREFVREQEQHRELKHEGISYRPCVD